MDLLQAIDQLAEEAHRGQVDKSGVPYIEHPRAVAALVRQWGGTVEQQMAGLLHDVVEDTPVTLEYLAERGVPPQVVRMVDALSRRPEESHEQYLARLIRTPEAILVKRADVTHNASPARLARLDEATATRLRAKYARTLRFLDAAQASSAAGDDASVS